MENPSVLNPNPNVITGPKLLHRLVSSNVSGDNVAVDHTSGDGIREEVTYAQLHERSNALASKLLLALGNTTYAGSRRFIVPLYMPQSPELYISQLAVLKICAAFCPIALDSPEERLRFILQDVEAKLLLTTTTWKERLPECEGIEVIAVDETLSTSQYEEQSITIDPSDAAYVMYTSGSTGQPKGVVLSHSAVTQSLLAHDRHIPRFSRFLQFANPTFDVSVFEIFFPLFRGSTIVSCDRRQMLNDLPGVINRLNVDAAELTPSVANNLLTTREGVPSLKLLLTIGEMLRKTVVGEFGGDANNSSILWGMYGPTEAAIHCTLQIAFARDMPVGNIGVPLETVSAFIVEPASSADPTASPQVIPIGEEGELALGGSQLADGYLNRDEQTKVAFVQHTSYGRLYRTGDRARLTLDGKLECLGRIADGQVKLRGQRIELGEIEYAASRTPGCKAVVADVVDGILIVFFIRNNASTTETDIRRTCQRWLPAFMIPGDIMFLNELPYLLSGKIDRKALKEQYPRRKIPAPSPTNELSSPLSRQIAKVVSNVLRVPIEPHTTLQGIGLDSLTAIRIASQLNGSGLTRLDANCILAARGISDIERLLASAPESQVRSRSPHDGNCSNYRQHVFANSLLSHSSDYVDTVYPSTSTQSAMLSETARDPQAYCNWIKFEFSNRVDLKAIDISLRKLADAHELLRSGFVKLSDPEDCHVTIVWRDLVSSQVKIVKEFDYNFSVRTEEDLLRPLHFQLLHQGECVQLLLQLHHALYDQWSVDVLKADLANLLRGGEIPSSLSYQDISSFHQANQTGAYAQQALEVWQDYLQGFNFTPVPQLNVCKMPNKLQRTSWRQMRFDTDASKSSSGRLDYSTAATFQAALAYILSTYTGNSDVVFGTVFSGRHIPVSNVESLFGPCLVTLPCRVDIGSTNTCLDLLRLVHDRNRVAQAHALTPLTEVRKAGQCTPGVMLFDTLFIWQESTVDLGDCGELIQQIDSADFHEFNLALEVEPVGSTVAMRATFQQSLIPFQQADLLLDQMEHVVNHLVGNLHGQITELESGLPLNNLSIVNPTPTNCAPDQGLVSAFEDMVLKYPTSPALSFARSIGERQAMTDTLNFTELNARANQWAYFLRSVDVLPNDIVCICMKKSVDFYVVALATLKVGAGYLPLVTETPVARVRSILSNANVKACLCDERVVSHFKSNTKATVIIISQIDPTSFPTTDLRVPHCGAHLAYLIFTSGSTGEPKGVAVTIDNLSGNLAVLAKMYDVRPGDRLLQACSLAFDVSVFEIFFALSNGMHLLSASKETLFRDLEHSIRILNITHLSLTPTVASLVKPENVPNVRFLITAGEAMTDVVHRNWAGRGLHQGYGPSETTNICSVNLNVSPDDVLGNAGPPFCNTSAFVLSPSTDFKILPAGALGELAFGGEQVFRGYLGIEGSDSSKFINHPQYGRIYKSGDSGRILYNGALLISGRLDDQAKLRGNRIELGEINVVVLQDLYVSDCATLICKDEVLATFWVPKSYNRETHTKLAQADPNHVEALFQRLEQALPQYMVPSILMPVTSMPRTSQGKLDRRMLNQLLENLENEVKSVFTRNFRPHNDGLDWSVEEETIANAVANTLRISRTGIQRTSSFLALGLNSLSAITLRKAIEDRVHKHIGIDTILRNPTAARLAVTLAKIRSSPERVHDFNISNEFSPTAIAGIGEHCTRRGLTVETILTCTPLQEVMLSASASHGSSTYCNSTVFRVSGDMRRLEKSWTELFSTPIFRTHFVQTDSPVHPYAQVVVKETTASWSYSDQPFDGTSRSDRSLTMNKAPLVSADKPFHLVPYRAESGNYLVIHMHHAIYDGISVSILLDEAERLYRGESLEAPVAFGPFLAQSLAQNSKDSFAFWSNRVKDYHPKPFPRIEAKMLSHEKTIEETLSVSVLDLETFYKRHSVTPLSVFQAAWLKVLHCAQRIDDICFGNVVSGRSVPVAGIDKLIAPCFNTLPVRIQHTSAFSNIQLVVKLHRQNIDTLNHQLTALRKIQTFSSSPETHLFDSMLLLQPPQQELDPRIWSQIEESGDMGIPVVLEILPGSLQFDIRFHWLSSYISDKLAWSLLHAFNSALMSCVKYPSGNVDHFHDFERTEIDGELTRQPESHATDHADIKQPEEDDSTWTLEESTIRDAFSELSGIDNTLIQSHTSLYQLGLDSLNAVQIASRLRKHGMRLDAMDVIENLTPRSIAKCLRGRRHNSEPNKSTVDLAAFDRQHRVDLLRSLDLEDHNVEIIRPCTAVQDGMIAQSFQSKGDLYINHITYEVPAGVAEADLARAWQVVQRKHQVLRMGFSQTGESRRPFMMLVYKPEASPNCVDSPVEPFDLPKVETENARSIWHHPDRPAWRVSLGRHQSKYVMLLSIHHALYDAESLQILLQDFQNAIKSQSLSPGRSIDSLLSATLGASQLQAGAASKFWQKTLEHVNAVKFPDLNPTIVQGGSLESLTQVCSIPGSYLESSARRLDVTIQALGQTAWALLLAAYVGEPRVTFGTIFSGRSSTEHQDIVFPSINIIPVSCEIGKPSSIIVKDMMQYNTLAQRHRFIALEEIHRIAGHAGRRLFDTVFVYQKTYKSSTCGFSWPMIRERAAVDYTASLELEVISDGSLLIRLTFDNSRIPSEQAFIMLKQYEHFLAKLICHDAGSNETQLKLYSMTPAKVQTLKSPVKLLHQFVERGAKIHPARPAMEFVQVVQRSSPVNQTWTYQQLDERSNQVAHLIDGFDIKAGSIVAVCMDKCPEASFVFIGILKAGCSFLAVDPDLPAARMKFILEDSGAKLLLTHGTNDGQCANIPRTEVKEEGLANFPKWPRDVGRVSPDDACYNLYTSGTTGLPKGCVITHENAVQAMLAFQKLFAGHWDTSSRWLQFASYWFDVSVLEQFWSWSVGMTVVGAPRDIVLDDLTGFIHTLEITHVDLTPSLARLLHPDDVPSLHGNVFITGGEALKQEIIDAWGSRRTVCNGYGPTEATIGVTMNTFIGPDAKPSNIGRPFDNVGTYVLAPGTDEPVIKGAVGELCVSGKLVGKEYLNRDDLTAKVFPFLDRFQEKVYRTGDLVRLLSDGSFAFLGRQDSQTKLRGQRLEITEIDNVIKDSLDRDVDVVSMVIKGGESKEMLVSFFSVGSENKHQKLIIDQSDRARESSITAERACKSRLPGYMVPTHIVPIPFLPLTVNNKVDGKALSTLFDSLAIEDLQRLRIENHGSGPLTDAELRIREAFCSMFEIDPEQVKRHTNVFSLGLSSVSAIAFAAHLKKSGFSNATIQSIMNSPTIGALAETLSSSESRDPEEHSSLRQAQLRIAAFAQRYGGPATQKLSVSFEDVESVVPCTPLQEGLLLDSIRNSERPYFNEFRYKLGDVAINRLKDAFIRLFHGVQVLRTRFLQMDEGFVQVVLKTVNLPWFHHDLGNQTVDTFLDERRLQWLEDNRHDVIRPIEILIVPPSSGNMMYIRTHHAIYDGISWDLLMERLAQTYQNDKSLDYGPDFTRVLPYGPLRTLSSAEIFWQRCLSGNYSAQLHPILDYKHDNDPTVTLHLKETAELESARKKLAVSHQTILQACFEIALQQHYPETSLYGLVLSGRSVGFDRVDQVLGPLFNTIPVAMNINEKDTWEIFIQRSHQLNLSILPFQHTPLRSIRKWCGKCVSGNLFDVLFVLQQESRQTTGEACGLWRPLTEMPRADYPLAFEVTLNDDKSITVIVVAQKLFADITALKALTQSFQMAVDTASRGTSQLISANFKINQHLMNSRRIQPSTPSNSLQVDGFVWNAQARNLRQAIAQLAMIDQHTIDKTSTIFSLGLDSIDAVKLSSRLKKYGISLPVSKILSAQTIPRMMQTLQLGKNNQVSVPREEPKLEKLERALSTSPLNLSFNSQIESIIPATPSQESLVADMLRSDFQNYYNHDILRLKPHVEVEKLKAAWQRVIDKSPILRTGFMEIEDPEVDAVIAQVINQPSQRIFQEISLPDIKDVDELYKKIRNDVKSEISGQSLLRLTLATTPSERYLFLSLAHAQYDGHSLPLLHDDVQAAYHGQYQERPSYRNVIEEALVAASVEATDFWSNYLSAAKVSRFPRSATNTNSSTNVRAEITSSISPQTAREFCQRNACSMQALTQTCWALVLAHSLQSLEVLFGAVLACRDSEESEQVMFPTMNTVVVRAALHGSKHEMLQYMQSSINDIRPFQKTPLRKILAVSANIALPSRSHTSLFDTIFIYQRKPKLADNGTDRLYESVGGSSKVEYPVAGEMEEASDKLHFRVACQATAMDQNGALKLLEKLETVFQSIIDCPNDPTVDFANENVSICGLSSFRLPDPDTPDVNTTTEGHKDIASEELPPLALTIREALAQVSKSPVDSIPSTATIESMGIDSISAIKVSAILRKKSVHLSVSQILRTKTLRAMTEAASKTSADKSMNCISSEDVVADFLRKSKVGNLPSAPEITQDNVESVLPATAGQIYMISVWELSGGQLFYPSFNLSLKGIADLQQIREAWYVLVNRHAVLRTIFSWTEDTQVPLLQVVLRQAEASFGVEDPVATSVQKPMVSLHASKCNEGYDLTLKIHHALYDAISLEWLVQDFRAILAGSRPDLAPIKQEDFMALSLTPEARQMSRTFWKDYLENVTPFHLDQPRTGAASRRIEIFRPGLSVQCSALEEKAKRERVTIQALLFASYAKSYSRLETIKINVGDELTNVVLGIYLSNRSHLPELPRLAAPTLNLVPLVVRSPAERGLFEVASQIQTDLDLIGTAEHSAVALWEIAEWTGVKIDTFVNFIKLPEQTPNDDVKMRSNTDIVLEALNNKRLEEYSRVTESKAGNFPFPEAWGKSEVTGSYLYSVDIEATVVDDALDVGLFCPEEMLGFENAKKTIEEIARLLETAQENPRV